MGRPMKVLAGRAPNSSQLKLPIDRVDALGRIPRSTRGRSRQASAAAGAVSFVLFFLDQHDRISWKPMIGSAGAALFFSLE
jgi:hypothetical protein